MKLVILASMLLVACSSNDCKTSVATYCSQSGHWPCRWSEWAQVPDAGPLGSCLQPVALFENCGPYPFAHEMGVDTSSNAYYDRASGNLIAITGFFNTQTSCSVGNSAFSDPQRTCADNAAPTRTACLMPSSSFFDAGTD